MNLQDIKQRLARKEQVTPAELAFAIANDRYLFFNYMLDNNLADVNQALRLNLGYSRDLPFEPSRKAIESVIDGMMQRNDTDSLNKIIREFDFNPDSNNYTTDPEFLTEFNKYWK